MPPSDLHNPSKHRGRNIVVAGSVLAAHVAGLWALHAGLLKATAIEQPKPEPVMVQLIAPEPEPVVAPPPPPPPPPGAPPPPPAARACPQAQTCARASTRAQAQGNQKPCASAQRAYWHDRDTATGAADSGAPAATCAAFATSGPARASGATG